MNIKQVLFILLVFTTFIGISQSNSQTVILDLGSKGKWEVMKEDFGKMKWYEALKACDELNISGEENWHIPSKDEMTLLFENKDKIGGFKEDIYWTGEQVNHQNAAWIMYFKDGLISDGYNSGETSYRYNYYTRAVRYINK